MPIHAAIFLITFSGLVFEIGLTRIYSATIWYHFAFVAISVALLGWGLGGLAVHSLKRRFTPSIDKAAALTLAYAITIPLVLGLVAKFPFRMERLLLYFIAPVVPFFLAGMALSMIFDLNRERAAKLYFSDLVGASLGALGVTFLLQALGGEAAVLVATAAPFAAAACLSGRMKIAGIAGAVLAIAGAATNEKSGLFRVVPGQWKAMHYQMKELASPKVAHTGWNSYSRIDAVEGFPKPYLARLYIDSDAWTSISEWDGTLESVREIRDQYRALPFKFTPDAETLVIGPGGGADVVAALAAGSRKVTAVELNPLMIEFVRRYGARAGNIYDRPDVEVVQSEGRNFISRTDRKFDVIFMGFVDTWASVSSGGLSLSENYLYTTEAFQAYYDHLKDDGLLVVLRWSVDVPRLVTNSVALLGAQEAGKRVVAVMEKRGTDTDPSQMIFMLRKRPFTEAETTEIMERWPLVKPLIVPGRVAPPEYAALFAGQKTLGQLADESSVRVDPVFDDSPFYFATSKPWGMSGDMVAALKWLLAPIVVLLVLFAAFGKPAGEPAGPYASSIAYFCCLGLGFISVELALLQNLTLLLGHPIFTLSILLFTILLASGVGSYISPRVPVRLACFAIAGLGILYALLLPKLVPALLPLPLAARVGIAVVLVASLGVPMGMPFPRGLSRAGRGPLPPPPFYWGLNGIMSVIGSVGTVAIAIAFGFRAAMIAGSACYVVAALASGFLAKGSGATADGVGVTSVDAAEPV